MRCPLCDHDADNSDEALLQAVRQLLDVYYRQMVVVCPDGTEAQMTVWRGQPGPRGQLDQLLDIVGLPDIQ